MNDFQKLGDALKLAADAVWVRMNDNSLSGIEKTDLNTQYQSLLDKSDDMYTAAVIAIGADVQSSIKKLSDAQADIASAIKKISSVQNIIDLTTKLVAVAGNILTQNYGKAISGIGDIIQSI